MIYTNVKLKTDQIILLKKDKLFKKNLKFLTSSQMIQKIKNAKFIVLDTETYGLDVDRQTLIDQYMLEKVKQAVKITATTKKSAIKYADQTIQDRALNCRQSNARLVQIKAGQDIFIFDSFVSKLDPLIKAINNKSVIGQNLKFDIKVLKQNYNYNAGQVWDVMIGYKLIKNSFTVGFFHADLARVVYHHLGIKMDKQLGASDWSQPISAEQFKYSVLDVYYLDQIAEIQINELNEASICQSATRYFCNMCEDTVSIIEQRFVPVLADIERAGIPIAIIQLSKRKKDFEHELKKLNQPFKDINTNSPAQLLEFLADNVPDRDLLSTAAPYLAHHLDVPIIKQLLRLKKVKKELQMITDYLEKWMEDDGRIYPEFNQMRGQAGRMSCFEPNMQQIPRPIKNLIYSSSKKRPVMRADFPQIEARIMSVVANDQRMLTVFRNKEDIHTNTVREVLRKQSVTKDDRDKAKPINFGFIYGMGAKTFLQYSFVNYGIEFTLEEASELRARYLQKYAGVARLHQHNSMLLAENRQIIISTLLGRRVMVDHFTNANNYPVQGSGADMIKLAADLFYERCKKAELDGRIINIVHDELVVDSAPKDAKKVNAVLQKSMEDSANFIIQRFETEVEVEFL